MSPPKSAQTMAGSILRRDPTRRPQRLQRKCACGAAAASLSADCAECSGRPRLQARLAVGADDDPLEREADRVADEVMRGPTGASAGTGAPAVQRSTDHGGSVASIAPSAVERVVAGPGTPLEPALRATMERRFGHDFSQVRIHADADAQRSANDLGADAYTLGHHIAFAANRYAPTSMRGRHLIAHELTHVLQQTGAKALRAHPGSDGRGSAHAGDLAHVVQPRAAGPAGVVRRRPNAAARSGGPPIRYRYQATNFRPSTGVGKIDVVEYNSETEVLTITVRPVFHFSPFNAARFPAEVRGDPAALAQARREFEERKAAYVESFVRQAESWGGQHVFFCQEPGALDLHATTRVEVDIVKESDVSSGVQNVTPVSVPDENATSGAHTHGATGAMNIPLEEGYTSRYDPATKRMVVGSIGPPLDLRAVGESGSASQDGLVGRAGLPDPPTPKPDGQMTFRHELGHVFGLGDEYAKPSDPTYAKGKPVAHSSLARSMTGKDVVHGENNDSVMALGNTIGPEHGVTFLEALQKLTGLRWAMTPAKTPGP